MKRLVTAISIFVVSITLCSGQYVRKGDINIGIDLLSPICYGTIRSTIGYGFAEKWSIGTDLGFDLRYWSKKKSLVEKEYWESIGSDPYGLHDDLSFRQNYLNLEIYVQYWFKEHFNGLCISMGGVLKDRENGDLTIGLGYCIPIWKGLRAEIRMCMGIIELYKNRKLPSDGIRVNLSYAF